MRISISFNFNYKNCDSFSISVCFIQVLALGGAKNHLVALADCDYKMAARDIVASFAGCCGQRCMAASVLILVDEEQQQGEGNVLDGLLAEILDTASKLLPGQEGGQVGPLIDPVAKKRYTLYKHT